MSQNTAPSLDALQRLAAIRDYVLDAQRQLKAGRMPDMAVLEASTSDLCQIIRDAAKDVQQQCAPELKELARELDDCEHELRLFYTTMTFSPDH